MDHGMTTTPTMAQHRLDQYHRPGFSHVDRGLRDRSRQDSRWFRRATAIAGWPRPGGATMREVNCWDGADAVQINALFKAYDVRGSAPDELTPEIAYAIGRALVASLELDEVAVGRDMRISGPALSAA